MGSIARLGSDAGLPDPTVPVENKHHFAASAAAGSIKSGLSDTVELERVPSSPQLHFLKSTNRTQFQQTLANAVTELRTAAAQTIDPLEAGRLSSLANKFQQLEETGVIIP